MKTKSVITTSTLLYWGLTANILAICGVLGGSLYIQIVLGEYPCPLCMVQRMSMMFCALGQIFILCRGNSNLQICWKDFAIGHSMTLFAALAGAAMSVRQILLHIVPPDPGYGTAIWGLHMYTWGLFVFVAEILAVALNLAIAPRDWEVIPVKWKKFSNIILSIFVLIILTFIIVTFIEEGFHWTLPDNPIGNSL